jgi:hypothetical protein
MGRVAHGTSLTVYETFHSIVFHKLTDGPTKFHSFFVFDIRVHAKEFHPRSPSLSAWNVFAAVAGNEPRRDVINLSAWLPCHVMSCPPCSRPKLICPSPSLQPMPSKFASDVRFGLKATIGAGSG